MEDKIHAYNLTPGDVVLLEGELVTVESVHNVVGACWIISDRPTYRYRIPDEDTVLRVDHKP